MDLKQQLKLNKQINIKFTNDEIYELEIEYNRYDIYKLFQIKLETILNLDKYSKFYNKKIYESKNIIDRFILECINYGLNIYSGNKSLNKTHIITEDKTDYFQDFKVIAKYLFFNSELLNVSNLKNTEYFKKMIVEYAEKNIRLTQIKINNIIETIIQLQNEFTLRIQNITQQLNTFTNKINCTHKAIKMQSYMKIICNVVAYDNVVKIKYRDYEKIISANRFYNLLKNYDKPKMFDIVKMLLRYSIFDNSNQQWSIGDDLYNHVSNIFDISFEMFASPLNFNMNRYCSIFYDTDKIFGSIGNFYDLNIETILNKNINGLIYNPPYLPILMSNTVNICIDLMNKLENIHKYEITMIAFLPNWQDADYINKLLNCKYVINYNVIKCGNFMVQEKDKGKLIRGAFELLVILMNSKKQTWTNEQIYNEKIENINKNFKDIIKIMKDETYWINI